MENEKNCDILDLEDEICPYTLIRALQEVKAIENEIRSGKKTLQVIVDHPPAIDNFPNEFGGRGYKVSIEKTGQARWTVLISA